MENSRIRGKVHKIYDGDTFTIIGIDDNAVHKVRLAQIDAPERSFFGKPAQLFSHESWCLLYSLVFDKVVTIEIESVDGYQRKVATVFVDDNVNVNVEMVRAGLAFVYEKYAKNDDLMTIEKDAKARKVGVWSVDDFVKPEIFRLQNN